MSRYRYLAGLRDINLAFQMAWTTVEGRETARRKGLGEIGYVAPSWSWASVEAAVLPPLISPSPGVNFGLCSVLDASVVLETEYAYSSVKAGWTKVRGRLNQIKSASCARSPFLIDARTDAKLCGSPDTVKGCEIPQSSKALSQLV